MYDSTRHSTAAQLGEQTFNINRQKGHNMPIERLYALLADEMGG
jgi:hypothetical protein